MLLVVVLVESTSIRDLVIVEMFKAHLVMIQRTGKSTNFYARKTEKGPRPGSAVKAPAYTSRSSSI